MTTDFCTHNDSVTVVACAKFRCDPFNILNKGTSKCHRICGGKSVLDYNLYVTGYVVLYLGMRDCMCIKDNCFKS